MEIKFEITIKLEEGKEICLNLQEAKDLFNKLKDIIGDQQIITYPVYPTDPSGTSGIPYPLYPTTYSIVGGKLKPID
jgi:hypothetical protein